MKTDIQIAQEAVMEPITEVAKRLDITEDELELYGKYKAKITDEYLEKIKNFLEKSNYEIDNIEYSDNVKVNVLIPLLSEEDAKKELINLLNGKIKINEIG